MAASLHLPLYERPFPHTHSTFFLISSYPSSYFACLSVCLPVCLLACLPACQRRLWLCANVVILMSIFNYYKYLSARFRFVHLHRCPTDVVRRSEFGRQAAQDHLSQLGWIT